MPWMSEYQPYTPTTKSYYKGKKIDFSNFMQVLNLFLAGKIETKEITARLGISYPTWKRRAEAIINDNPLIPWEDWFSDIPEELLRQLKARQDG